MGMHSLIKTTWQTFRQGRSCLSNLLELFEDITATRDKGKSMDVVYLNFEGGFCIQNECPCCGLPGEAQGSGREGTACRTRSIGKRCRNSNDLANLMHCPTCITVCIGEGAVLEVTHHEVGRLRKQRASVDVSGRRGHLWKPRLRELGDKATC